MTPSTPGGPLGPTAPLAPGFWSPPAWALMTAGLSGLFWLHLAAPFVSALALFSATLAFRDLLARRWPQRADAWAPVLSSLLALVAVAGLIWGVVSLLDDRAGLAALAAKMSDILALLKDRLPPSLSGWLPNSTDTLSAKMAGWLAVNAVKIPAMGGKVLTLAFHLIVGAIVGIASASAFLSHRQAQTAPALPSHPMVTALLGHLNRFRLAFEQVVLSQLYIAVTNALFTGIFLLIVMPLLGLAIPFAKTLVAVTLVCGLVPILGNITSNAIITVTALSVSPLAAGLALGFLIVIHKLEYFLNAWIIGTRIKVRAFEILGAMLLFEALFGLWGMALAAVLYAYAKEEVRRSAVASPLPPSQPLA